MRVTLLHNPSAGDEGDPDQPTTDELYRLLRRFGHVVHRVSDEKEEWRDLLRQPTDLVAAAGGDGTVAKVARALIGIEPQPPMAILPIGTANNIAAAFAIEGPLEELVGNWQHATHRTLDVGEIIGAEREPRLFVEGSGLGWFARALCHSEKTEENDRSSAREDAEREASRYLLRLLERMKPMRYEITADGADLSGEYLLIEALNIRSIGSRLVLAPTADPGDGLLDVVMASDDDREQLASYLRAKVEGEQTLLTLPTRRAARLSIRGSERDGHYDDEPFAVNGPLDITARVGAVDVL